MIMLNRLVQLLYKKWSIFQSHGFRYAEISLISVRRLTRFWSVLALFQGGGGAWGSIEVALDDVIVGVGSVAGSQIDTGASATRIGNFRISHAWSQAPAKIKRVFMLAAS